MKQAVRKKINKKRYLYPLPGVPSRWSRTVESMVFTLFALPMRRALHNGCRDGFRGKLSFLYPSNKILLQFSWTQFPVNHNKWSSKHPTLIRDAIQYETKRDFSTSPYISLAMSEVEESSKPSRLVNSQLFSKSLSQSFSKTQRKIMPIPSSLESCIVWQALYATEDMVQSISHAEQQKNFWRRGTHCEEELIAIQLGPAPKYHI